MAFCDFMRPFCAINIAGRDVPVTAPRYVLLPLFTYLHVYDYRTLNRPLIVNEPCYRQ